jgi:Zn-finger protein
MTNQSYKFFQNKQCVYFPCHKGISTDKFNCMYCFCPQYLIKDCIGKPKWVGHFNKIKDCSNCLVNHGPNSYEAIVEKVDWIEVQLI